MTAALCLASPNIYLNNRYYDPQLGIFLSVDPLVSKTGEPYLYANGNPTTLSDPAGLCPVYSPTQGIVDDGHGKCQGTSHVAPRPKAPPVKPAGPPTFSWLTMPSTCDDAGIPWLCRHLGFDDHSQGATIARSIAFGAMMSGGGEPEVPPGLAAAEAELDALVERTSAFRDAADVGGRRTAAGARLSLAGEECRSRSCSLGAVRRQEWAVLTFRLFDGLRLPQGVSSTRR